ASPLFSDAACAAVAQASAGIPRTINILCNTALVYGFAKQADLVSKEIIDLVIADKQDFGVLVSRIQRPLAGSERTKMQDDPCSHTSKDAQLPKKKRFSISSRVIPGLMIALDSLVILSSALISYIAIVSFGDPDYYAAAVAFVWLVTIMLMNIGGLYEFDPITRPLAFVDKIVVVFATTFCFLLAAAFALKISTEYSRIWAGSFALSSCVATILFRVFAAQIIGRLADRNVFSRNVVVVGSGEQLWKLLDSIDKSQPRFVTLLGVFAESRQVVPTDVSPFAIL